MECLEAIIACRLNTRNSLGRSGNVLEDLPALSEPPAVFFGQSRSSASAHCEPVSQNTGRLADRANEMGEKRSKFCNTNTEICKEVFNPPLSCRRSLSAELNVEQPRNQDSDPNHCTFQCWKRVSRPRCVPVPSFPQTPCCGSKMWRMVDSVDDLKTS